VNNEKWVWLFKLTRGSGLFFPKRSATDCTGVSSTSQPTCAIWPVGVQHVLQDLNRCCDIKDRVGTEGHLLGLTFLFLLFAHVA
jgi:hypothetical protein